MFVSLMRARRFAALFWTQFFSAFNDNFVRNMLAMVILFKLGEAQAGPLITIALGLFILPSIFLSAPGGEIADANDKALIARRLKFAEIFVQMIAAAGFWCAALPDPWPAYSLPLLYTALFGLGVIAALFGPIKYGILPDQLKTSELPAGNALIEGATFLAILLGIIAGGYAASGARSAPGIVVQLMAVALACWGASRFIPSTRVAAPGLKVNPNVIASTLGLIREIRGDLRQWTGALGMSWFWLTGTVTLSLVPVLLKSRLGAGLEIETAINAIFAIGIGIGSILAAVISHGRIFLLPVPLAALAMAGFLIDLGLATSGIAPLAHDAAATPVWDFFQSAKGLRVTFDVFGLALAGGLFAVPLFSAFQSWAGEDRRARAIAANNVLNAVFMAGAAGVTALLQSSLVGLSEPVLITALGALNIGAAVLLFRNLPADFLGDALNLLFRVLFRLEVKGQENVTAAGEHCVLAVNHLSFLDAPVMLALTGKDCVFAIDSGIAQRWWVKPFLKIARAFPMDPTKPLSTRTLINEVKAGNKLIIFPEGRITVTGSLMKVYDGAAMIADKANAMVVPVRLEGLERTYFSRLKGGQVRRKLFPKVRVTFMPAQKLEIDQALRGKARRQAAGAALYDVMSDLIFETTNADRLLIHALHEAARDHGMSKIVLEDPVTGKLTAKKLLIGAAVLGRKIMAFTQPGENVGQMLPNANGAAVTWFALQAAGRVPAMLNYTAGPAALIAACKAAEVKTILSSRAFIDKANLKAVVAELEAHATIVWLEDVRTTITLLDKLRGLIDIGKSLSPRQPQDPAAVLFTSGSEGLPKGVVLSHRNLIGNVAQIMARFDITAQDVVFNVLPVFHSFGMTGGMLLPLLSGMKLYLYPSPLHYRQIPELVYGSNATVLFGTDTFLNGYARMANPYDFRSLRYVVAGAEPVKAETRRVYSEKFGLRILEGYGVTETSPVLAVNTPMFNRAGTVGRLMPGVEHRLELVPGIDTGGRLHVRGPNVMLGYYRTEKPGQLEPTKEGWHDTGDICVVDHQKFVTIKGRVKRFAKIAGEMVSLAGVEALCADLWPEHMPAVVNMPDAKKGERLVMVTTKSGALLSEVRTFMKGKGATELMVPAEVIVVDALPLLGSGKTDYVGLNRLVRGKLGLDVAA